MSSSVSLLMNTISYTSISHKGTNGDIRVILSNLGLFVRKSRLGCDDGFCEAHIDYLSLRCKFLMRQGQPAGHARSSL